jgi:hypothetical protein
MATFVECICGKKYEIDRAQVEQFDCACGRNVKVPDAPLIAELDKLRARMREGEPGMRDAMTQLAAMRNFHAVPLLKEGAASGVRDAVNTALVGLIDYPGPGQDALIEWIRGGTLTMARLVTALREQKYAGADFLCGLIEKDQLKENQVAEVANYLGESDSHRALEVLRAARRRYPNLGSVLDDAMQRMKHLSGSAGAIPDEAKRIPGREEVEEPEAKKGCAGLLLALMVVIGMLAALFGWS